MTEAPLSLRKAAARFGVDRKALRAAIDRRELRGSRRGARTIRVDPAEVKAWLLSGPPPAGAREHAAEVVRRRLEREGAA